MKERLQKSSQRQQFRPRFVAIFGLFAFALMQVSFASHQFEHLAGDVADACLACAQYDRLDDAAIAESVELRVIRVFLPSLIETSDPADLQPVVLFSIRAPPYA